ALSGCAESGPGYRHQPGRGPWSGGARHHCGDRGIGSCSYGAGRADSVLRLADRQSGLLVHRLPAPLLDPAGQRAGEHHLAGRGPANAGAPAGLNPAAGAGHRAGRRPAVHSAADARSQTMIESRGVSKRYGDVLVVDDVSLSIPRGGFTSIIGPNGAGKSTLLSMISRLTPMSAGSVQVDGMDVTRTPGNVLARRLSILRQDNQTSLRLTVRDLVAFGRFPHSGGRLTAEDLRHVDEA